MLVYQTGDLLQVEQGVIAHGVNCRGVMGAGVAALIKQQYPAVYDAYRSRCLATEGKGLLGTVQHVQAKEGLVVANCFTQLNHGIGERHVNYEALARCFYTLNKTVGEVLRVPLNIPMIGAGLAGGDWNVISSIIDSEYKHTVYCWKLEGTP
jgi:O-acetyl-ADP-ribose deacetylase (regulator of RNase III)